MTQTQVALPSNRNFAGLTTSIHLATTLRQSRRFVLVKFTLSMVILCYSTYFNSFVPKYSIPRPVLHTSHTSLYTRTQPAPTWTNKTWRSVCLDMRDIRWHFVTADFYHEWITEQRSRCIHSNPTHRHGILIKRTERRPCGAFMVRWRGERRLRLGGSQEILVSCS